MSGDGLPAVLLNGVSSDCPFCLSIYSQLPKSGEEFTFLSGFHCGITARMIEVQSTDRGTFTYGVPDDLGSTYIGNRSHEDILALRLFGIPEWAPPLAVEDAHKVHWAFANEFIQAHYDARKPSFDYALIGLVGCLWSWRLPVCFEDIWPMLLAHGWPPERQAEGASKLDFALEAIRCSAGRRPIKRRRLRPFETWRYEPRRKAT